MLLDFLTKGSLLSHLPIQYRQLDSLRLAIEVALDKKNGKKYTKIEIWVHDLFLWACYIRLNRYVCVRFIEGLSLLGEVIVAV
jgi:hypothetical protein